MNSTFASDNLSTVHPAVMEQLQRANTGHQASYGEDRYTAEATKLFERQFGPDTQVCFLTTGTAANVLSLKLLLTRPYEAVILPATSHVVADEVGAPQSVLGVQLFPLPSSDGKLTVAALRQYYTALLDLDIHASLPKVVSIAQSTESGTIYTVEEVKAIAQWCHEHDMYLHMDGCRLPNAAVALGVGLRAITHDAGVDVLSFGGAKNGLMNAEAVVIFNAPQSSLPRMQKQILQLSSKMRFVSSQFIPYLADDLWRQNAETANRLTAKLAAGLRPLPGIVFTQDPQTNQLFLRMPRIMIDALRAAGHQFFDWDTATREVRLVTSWDNTDEDVDGFLAEAEQSVSAQK